MRSPELWPLAKRKARHSVGVSPPGAAEPGSLATLGRPSVTTRTEKGFQLINPPGLKANINHRLSLLRATSVRENRRGDTEAEGKKKDRDRL